MAKYQLIDPELYAWAAKHSLQIFTEYKDVELRSTDFVGVVGKKCQIWIDQPEKAGAFVINIWNYKKKPAKRLKQLQASKTDIRDKLEEATRRRRSGYMYKTAS